MSLGGGGGAGVAEWKVSPAVGDHSTYGRYLPPWDGQVPKSGVCCGVTLCPGVCGPLGPANVRGANLSAIEGNVGLESLKALCVLLLCPGSSTTALPKPAGSWEALQPLLPWAASTALCGTFGAMQRGTRPLSGEP